MTNAQRQAKYRNTHVRVFVGDQITATIRRLAADFDLGEAEVTRELLANALCNRNWRLDGFPSSRKTAQDQRVVEVLMSAAQISAADPGDVGE
jgi:hypothetical protein